MKPGAIKILRIISLVAELGREHKRSDLVTILNSLSKLTHI